MPGIPAGDLQQQIRQQYAYLFQLAQALNRALEQLEETRSERKQSAAQTAWEQEERSQQTAAGLKSLIVKTAETVSRQMEQMKTELRGEYVAVSDFGTYLERTSQEIEEDPTKITRYFKFAADIQADVDKVETEQGVFDVIDKRSNMSVWTTEKLSFYIGGQEAAYFSNGKLTVAQIATDRLTGAGKWDVSFTGGVKFKWIGG